MGKAGMGPSQDVRKDFLEKAKLELRSERKWELIR